MKQITDLESLSSLCRKLSSEGYFLRDDSRKVQEGDLFIAIKGFKKDGHQFISKAVQRGANIIISESSDFIPSQFQGFYYITESTKKIRSFLLNQYYNHISEKLFCIGITGTNGKTSTAYMLEHILSFFGWRPGLIGTIHHRLGDNTWKSSLTTPSPLELYQRMKDFYEESANSLVMEVSSIGLDQGRVDGLDFNLALFTNFSQDHLDYHKTMEEYFKAKTTLFEKGGKHFKAVFNAEDPYIYNYIRSYKKPFLSYGRSRGGLRYKVLKSSTKGLEINILFEGNSYFFKIPVVGIHNVENIAAALAVAQAIGFSVKSAGESLEFFKGVPGRLEPVLSSDKFHVFVDYAHTEEALKNVLKSLRSFQDFSGKIITVFGCGGGRDVLKRKNMAQVVQKYSDNLVLTSDNPRDEDPEKIIQDMLQGISKNSQVCIEIDRKKAIQKGMEKANSGDIVLVAGKGHEEKQIVKGGEEIKFHDPSVVRSILGKV